MLKASEKGDSGTAMQLLKEVATFLVWMTVVLLPGGLLLACLLWLYRHFRKEMRT
jgi:hypothetical protein